MKRGFNILLAIAVFAGVFYLLKQYQAGQGGDNPSNFEYGQASLKDVQLEYIPTEATSVNTVNLQSMLDKMDFEEVKKMDFYRKMMEDSEVERPELVYLMENPQESGVNLDKNIYMFSDMDEDDMDNSIAGTVMQIKDVDKFEAMLKNADQKGALSIEKKGKYNLARMGNRGAIVWNDKVAIAGGGGRDSDALADKLVDMLTKKPSKSIQKNKDFKKNFKGNHDFFSYNSSKFLSSMANDEANMILEAFNLTPKDLEDNYTITYGDFKDGKLEAKQEYILNAKVKEMLKAIIKEDVSTDFTKYIPAENMVGVFTGGLNVRGINQLMSEMGMAGGAADMVLNGINLSRDDIMKAIDGDVFVATYMSEGNNEPSFLGGLKIADQKLMDKILEVGTKFRVLKKTGKNVYQVSALASMLSSELEMLGNSQFVVEDGMLLFGNEDNVQKVNRGNFKRASRSDIGDGAFGFYADMEAINDAFPNIKMDEADEIRMSGNLSGSSSSMTFKNKDENGLKKLMKIINEVYMQGGDLDDLKIDM